MKYRKIFRFKNEIRIIPTLQRAHNASSGRDTGENKVMQIMQRSRLLNTFEADSY